MEENQEQILKERIRLLEIQLQESKLENERLLSLLKAKKSDEDTLKKQVEKLEQANEDLLFQLATALSGSERPKNSLSLSSFPLEIKKHIFSFLPAQNLSGIGLVCKEWHMISNYPGLWKLRYEEDQYTWKVFIHVAANSNFVNKLNVKRESNFFKRWSPYVFDFLKRQDPSLIDNSSSSAAIPAKENWKELYLQQYLANRINFQTELTDVSSKPMKPKSNSSLFSSKSSNTSSPFVIPILGEGTILSGKNFIKKLMWVPNSPMTTLHAGVEGIGSGVGFKIDGEELNLVAFYQGDRKVFNQIRPVWQNFFKNVSGFILVIDSLDIEPVKKVLEQYIQDGFLLPDVPLLVFSLIPTDQYYSLHLAMIGKRLGLEDTRTWSIRKINFETLEGVWSGLSWLVQQIHQKN